MILKFNLRFKLTMVIGLQLVKLRQQEAEKQVEEKKKQTKTRVELKAFTSGVGKYINPQLK